MNILSIDPGNIQSGWVEVVARDEEHPRYMGGGVSPNHYDMMKILEAPYGALLIECPKPMGMPAIAEVFETLIWVGRFIECWEVNHGDKPWSLVFRNEVKMHMCNSMRAKDKNVNAAVADRYPDTGGGKTPVKGTKAQPGPLFGIGSHQWPALAVAITWIETGRPICHEIKGKQKTKKEKSAAEA